MSEKNTGGFVYTDGLTLRDCFAGLALTGLIAAFTRAEKTQPHDADRIAEDAYVIADAMLKERGK